MLKLQVYTHSRPMPQWWWYDDKDVDIESTAPTKSEVGNLINLGSVFPLDW